ncbi:MAG: FHA domain-containing protein [Chloroflexota bacterium]
MAISDFPLRRSGPKRASRFSQEFAAFLSVCLLSILLPVLVSAQAQPGQLLVNQLSMEEQQGKQDLNVYFTVLDTQQKVVVDPKITPNTLMLDINGTKIDPQTLKVDTPTNPLYIVFLLDTSGANYAAGNAMLTGVKKAMQGIEQSSKNTTFAVAQFSDQITLLTSGFTNSAGAAVAVDRIKEYRGSNCLFNAAYDAQNLFQPLSPTARRALVIVTGGKDSDKYNANKLCSQNNTAQSVIKQAQTLPFIVPIYVVGMRRPNYPRFDDALVQTLTGITQQTGGTISVGPPEQGEALFQSVADAFANQRVVQTSICIAQNPANKAILSMSASGTPLTSAQITFSTNTNCSVIASTATPSPFSIALSPGTYSPGKEEFTFKITRQGDADLTKYHISTKYKATNTQLPGEAGDFFVAGDANQPTTTVTFSTKEARAEGFVVTVEAIGTDGSRIGTPMVQEYQFDRPTATPTSTIEPSVTPLPFTIALTPGTYSLAKEEFTFKITRQGDADLAKYHISTKYKATNTQLPGEAGDFFIATDVNQPTTTVTFSTKEARAEGFVVTVEAIGNDGSRIGTPVVQEYGFERPTATPTSTIEPTVTTVPPSVELLGIRLDPSTNEIVWNLRTGDLGPVTGYTIRVLGKNNIVVYEKTFNAKPSSEVRIPASSVPTGDYTFVVELAVPNMSNPPSFSLSVTYTTPPAPPKPIWEQIGFPMLCALVVIVAICIFGAIWLLLARRPRAPRLPKAPPPPQQSSTPNTPKREQNSVPLASNETVFQNTRGEAAFLEIERSPEMAPGKRVDITTTPFWLGRNIDTKDGLTIPDTGISRLHTFITFENGEYYINGSKTLNGTQINDEPLGTYDNEGWTGGKRSLSSLYRSSGKPVRIALGNETVVKFSLIENSPKSGGPKPQTAAANIPPADESTAALARGQGGGSSQKPKSEKAEQVNSIKDSDYARPMPKVKLPAEPPVSDETYRLPAAKKNAGAPAVPEAVENISLPTTVAAQLQLVSVYNDALNRKLGLPIQYAVESSLVTIGSDSGNNDTRIPSPEVAREHLLLIWRNSKFHLRLKDKESRTSVNGTFMAAGEEISLTPNTRYTIQIGTKTVLSFFYTDTRISTGTLYSA